MNPIDLGIKFVKTQTTSLAQTGDLSSLFIAGIVLFALSAIVALIYVYSKKRQLISDTCMSNKASGVFNIQKSILLARIVSVVLAIVALLCIFFGCFFQKANAANSNPLVPDKNDIIATVEEDGTFTLDTCTITNNGINKFVIDKSSVKVADEVADIKSLSDSSVVISGFGGKLFDGKADGAEYKVDPKSSMELVPQASTQLTIKIDLSDPSVVSNLLGKKVFSVSIVPTFALSEYKSLEVTSKEHSNIMYAPVFQDNHVPNGVTFYQKNDDKFTEVVPQGKSHVTKMSDLKTAVNDKNLYYTNTGKSTLYAIRCVYNKDKEPATTWNDISSNPPKAGGFVTSFNDECGYRDVDSGAYYDAEYWCGLDWRKDNGEGPDASVASTIYYNSSNSYSTTERVSTGVVIGKSGDANSAFDAYGSSVFNSDWLWTCVADDVDFANEWSLTSFDWRFFNRDVAAGVVFSRAFH